MSDKKTILIVDDDIDFQQAMKTLLETRNYNIILASDGDEGYEKAKKEKPDLLLLDVMMKKDNEGFLTAQKMKADQSTGRIPVILITGIRKAKNLPFGFEPDPDWLPVKAVLEKPVKADDLLREIAAALE